MQSQLFSTLLFFGFLLLFMYIVIIRPQNKRNKEINEMLSKLEVGTEVIAASGIIGKVKAIKGEYISCLLYTSPSPRDMTGSRMPSSA